MLEEIIELFKLDFQSVIIGIIIILSVIISVYEIVCKIIEIFKKPKKWLDEKNEDHELLIQTAKNLNELQKRHEEDVAESNKHDEKIENDIKHLTKIIVDKSIEDYRWAILDFCSALSNGRVYNREAYNHIFLTYELYEKVLQDNKMTNGLIEESISFIKSKYKELLERGELK